MITFVDEDRLWHLREESQVFAAEWTTGACYDGDVPYVRPVSDAGANQSIGGGTSTTVDGSGSTSTQGYNYQWTFVSGPTVPIISSPLTVSTSITGMTAPGTYTIRLVVTNNEGARGASWMTIFKE